MLLSGHLAAATRSSPEEVEWEMGSRAEGICRMVQQVREDLRAEAEMRARLDAELDRMETALALTLVQLGKVERELDRESGAKQEAQRKLALTQQELTLTQKQLAQAAREERGPAAERGGKPADWPA